jgi:hypothetical protein
MLDVNIGINNSLAQAQMAGLDIFEFDPRSRGAQQYEALAASVHGMLNG